MGSTLAFWLGNPVLNPATLIFMGFVLSWHWALVRVVVGIVMVFGVAALAERFFPAEHVPQEALAAKAAITEEVTTGTLFMRWLKALWELTVSLVPEYLIIVALLGAARAWLFPAITPALGHSWWMVLAMAIAGTLFVIPTAGEVPIVQSLMSFGLGAGPAGALLMTLPAVSLPSLVMMGRVFPARVLVFVAGAVAVLGVAAGYTALALGI